MTVDRALLRRSAPPVSKQALEVEKPLVIIIDDDAAIREALSELILSAGSEPVSFGSTRELLEADVLDSPGCLILDVRMPGGSGLDLQRQLAGNGNPKPIIFLTGHGDIPMTVQAMKAGAVDFLTKPVRNQTLLDAVIAAIAMDAARRAESAVVERNVERLNTLTLREREVLHGVARGRLNKQIAFDLGISEATVKLHRGRGMRKMEAASIGELIRIWETLPMPMREVVATLKVVGRVTDTSGIPVTTASAGCEPLEQCNDARSQCWTQGTRLVQSQDEAKLLSATGPPRSGAAGAAVELRAPARQQP